MFRLNTTSHGALGASVASALAAAVLAACGGGGGDALTPVGAVPTLAAATGPLGVVPDSSTGFTSPPKSATEYDKHLALATANAGTKPAADAAPAPGTAAQYDPAALRTQWCYTAEHTSFPPELSDHNIVPPTQMFDNMWSFGPRWVLQYAFKADNGKSFLIDTLNNTGEAQSITEPGLLAMGSSASQLEGAMPTHGHGDHYGGAGYLQQTYGIPIYLGSADAKVGATATPPFTVTQLDSSNLQPQAKDFGGLPMTLLSTPGHTVGTFSGIVPAKLNGKTYHLAFWGGTGMPSTISLAQQYLDGSERLYRLSAAQKVDGTIHTHPFVDGSLAKLDALKANPQSYSSANPFLIGNALALRSLSILRECSAAKVAQLDATAKIPAWITTAVQVTQATNYPEMVQATAVVTDPFGFVQNGQVKFTAQPGGQTCTSFTNAKGVAGCTFPANTANSVTAEFTEGALSDGTVELASSASAPVK
jgi:metallo-beta-lactamase class B